MSESNTPTRQKGKLAGFTLRVFSSLYDLIMLFAVTFLFVALPISGIEYGLGQPPADWVQKLLFIAVSFAYYVGFWYKGDGATTGMRTWKLKLANIDTGDKPTLMASTIRFLGFGITLIAMGYTFYCLKTGNIHSMEFVFSSLLPVISLLSVMMTPQKQTLHDLIARTSVYQVLR